ncbi:MAG: helix-turn-helix domain-containing protein [Patescibacteria group bacterium]|nr:helix-turn-helix domain-containing protein [Patescibacteria group bacterium]MDE2438455.1 helix-turn-helix domain-containing protein [Patescibacteria group bacterium]
MTSIHPENVYTTQEAQDYLKISMSTMKRLLKKGILRANKIGGQYRILGRELLRLVSPEIEEHAVRVYQKVKRKTKATIEHW